MKHQKGGDHQTVCNLALYRKASSSTFIDLHLQLPQPPTTFNLQLPRRLRFILLQNRQGKTRLVKYYVPLEDSEKHKVHRLVVNRNPKFTNFVEFGTHKVIYRRYTGLFFSLCVDITDNELAYLECIH